MKLYLLKRTDQAGYDEYRSCVVVAKSPSDARRIHPSLYIEPHEEWWKDNDVFGPLMSWAKPGSLDLTYLGEATAKLPRGVVCADFIAG
jgi:hypothetical protein